MKHDILVAIFWMTLSLLELVTVIIMTCWLFQMTLSFWGYHSGRDIFGSFQSVSVISKIAVSDHNNLIVIPE